MSLSQVELELIDKLSKKLSAHHSKNEELEHYYEGKNRLKDLQISIPPQLTAVESVVGWAGTAVDILEERLDFEGYIGGDALGLNDIYRANELDLEQSLAHKDALIYGVGFVVVGKGAEGEANELITIESPKNVTVEYDIRTRRPAAGLLLHKNKNGNPSHGSLYLPDVTISIEYVNGMWIDVDRDEHRMGRVRIVPLVNNPRSADSYGRSEITRGVRSLTNAAMRTMLGAEVAREFYSAPQRYVLGADENVFTDKDGNPLNAWSVYQGRLLDLPYNREDNVMPQIGQFAANDPRPYFDQIKAYAQMMAAETAIPASYFGFQTDNPASADAIRQMEARLIKRAERRQKQFGRAWSEVAKLAIMVRDGISYDQLPSDIESVRPVWRDASTPTRAASADEAIKLIQAGVLTPDSEITYGRIGLSAADKEILKAEKAKASATTFVQNLADAARAAQQTTQNAVTSTPNANTTNAG